MSIKGWTDRDMRRNLEEILDLLWKDIRNADTPSDVEDGQAYKILEKWIKDLKEEEESKKS